MVSGRGEAPSGTEADHRQVENVLAISVRYSTNFLLRSRLAHPLRLGHATFTMKSISLCRRIFSTVRRSEISTTVVALKRMRRRTRR